MMVKEIKFMSTSRTFSCKRSSAIQTLSTKTNTMNWKKFTRKAINQCSNFQGWFRVYFIILKAALISSSWLMWRKTPQMNRLSTTVIYGGGVEKFISLSSLGFKVQCQRNDVKPSCDRTRKQNLFNMEFLAMLNLLRQSSISFSYSSSDSLSVYSVKNDISYSFWLSTF